MNSKQLGVEVAARLRAERARADLTLRVAGEKAGIHYVSISRYEGGKLPTLEALYLLAEVRDASRTRADARDAQASRADHLQLDLSRGGFTRRYLVASAAPGSFEALASGLRVRSSRSASRSGSRASASSVSRSTFSRSMTSASV